MADLRIRNMPDSRTEYLRRRLARDAVDSGGAVTVEDFRVFAATFGDLGDAAVMQRAWE